MGSISARSTTVDPQLKRHVSDLYPTLSELEAANEAAQALVASPGWNVLQNMLGAEIDTIDAGLDSGRPLEHVEYASKHGRRGGLRGAAAAMHALIEHAESELARQREKHEGGAESSPER